MNNCAFWNSDKKYQVFHSHKWSVSYIKVKVENLNFAFFIRWIVSQKSLLIICHEN